jgi:hypothetical protein
MTDFDDPAQRAALIERVGPDEYNRQLKEHLDRSTVEVVSGYGIRLVRSMLFGPIYMVDGLGKGHATLDGARKIAREAERKP